MVVVVVTSGNWLAVPVNEQSKIVVVVVVVGQTPKIQAPPIVIFTLGSLTTGLSPQKLIISEGSIFIPVTGKLLQSVYPKLWDIVSVFSKVKQSQVISEVVVVVVVELELVVVELELVVVVVIGGIVVVLVVF